MPCSCAWDAGCGWEMGQSRWSEGLRPVLVHVWAQSAGTGRAFAGRMKALERRAEPVFHHGKAVERRLRPRLTALMRQGPFGTSLSLVHLGFHFLRRGRTWCLVGLSLLLRPNTPHPKRTPTPRASSARTLASSGRTPRNQF